MLASVESLFTESATAHELTIGAELELIPFDVETLRSVPITSGTDRGSLSVMRSAARGAGWSEVLVDADPPSWSVGGKGRVSYEPGGQIELSTAPCATASELIRDLQCTAQLLASSFERVGIRLEATGVDPYNHISEVALQLHRPRYELMTRYFDSIGPSGAKMMRQTASLQINVQSGPRPCERWWLLNALAPYVTAIFANSPVYCGEATGHRSYRAHLWRALDVSRTGLVAGESNVATAYFDFAMSAFAMMRNDVGPYSTFEEWMRTGNPTDADWELHLTTLFPEVRPRGYFEIRSADTIRPHHLAAPICFVAGLVYDGKTARDTAEILALAGPLDLELAGRAGLADSAIRETAAELVHLALSGCELLGEEYVAPADLEAARDFFDSYTLKGRSPADDWSDSRHPAEGSGLPVSRAIASSPKRRMQRQAEVERQIVD